MAALFRRILGRTNQTSQRTSELPHPSSSSNRDNKPEAQSTVHQTAAARRKFAIEIRILITGAPGAGLDSLARRLAWNVWDPNYCNPTLTEPEYRKVHRQHADGLSVLLNYTPCRWPTKHREYLAMYQHYIRESKFILLVYRVDDAETSKWLEEVYTMYIMPKDPPAVRVWLVATCADLLLPDGCGRDLVNEGRALAEKYALDFYVVSSRTGEGGRELIASLVAAALSVRC